MLATPPLEYKLENLNFVMGNEVSTHDNVESPLRESFDFEDLHRAEHSTSGDSSSSVHSISSDKDSPEKRGLNRYLFGYKEKFGK
jgi:hypothetical protein